MYDDEIFGLMWRTLGKLFGFGAKTIFNAITDDFSSNPGTNTNETLPPAAEPLRISGTGTDAQPHGFIFGEQQGITIGKDETEDGHIMVVGGAGSGKSSCIAIPSLLAWNECVFAIDIKGELYEATKHKRRYIKVFNPLDANALGYDPFYLLRHASNQAQEAKAIAYALVPLPPDIKDPFWVKSAQNLFTGAILHFFNMGYSFIDTVLKVLSTPIDSLINEIYTSETQKAAYFVNSLVDLKIETLSGISAELSNHIELFATDDDIVNCLSKKEIITPEDIEYRSDIYIQIPEYMLEQWKNLLALMVNQFMTHFEKRQDMVSTPVLFLLDEFARLGKVERIVDGLATLRSKKISICIILQSLAQLDLHYGKVARQVIADNCQYKAILNATDVETQEYFSKAVGTYDKYMLVRTQQYERFTNFKAGTSISTHIEEKPRIKPPEFATLNHAILLTPYGAFKVDKKPYYIKTALSNRNIQSEIFDLKPTPIIKKKKLTKQEREAERKLEASKKAFAEKWLKDYE